MPRLLTMLLSLSTLVSCETLTGIVSTEPAPPSQTDVVRLLCARNSAGNFIFGPVLYSKLDNPITQRGAQAHNDAWDAATKKGELCGGMGAAPFGGMKWGTK